jgi:RHS repeat-associated protein
MDMQYVYPAGQNNGRVSQTIDGVTGETVSYTYDGLNRLSTAQTADSSWGQAYTYDGWGNLSGKTVTKGTAPTYSATPDPTRNGGADPTVADGWYATDVEGRNIGLLWQFGAPTYTYDQAGKMVFALDTTSGQQGGQYTFQACELRFYGINGQRLATYGCYYTGDGTNVNWGFGGISQKDVAHKEAGQLTGWIGKWVVTDRLGSVRADGSGGRYTYYPYGEVKTSTGQAGLYADMEDPVRAYDSNGGRWTSPDPLGLKGVSLGNPTSWNRYAYANGDPVSLYDPAGTNAFNPDSGGGALCWGTGI